MRSARSCIPWLLGAALVALMVGGYFLYRGWGNGGTGRMKRLMAWFNNPAAHPEWRIRAGERCGEAPFVFPTDGYIGFIWGDSFRPGHRHQGLDIFGAQKVNTTPVVAAYPGYLTREANWKSAVIMRIPQDPLQPGRQIWAYYTHMADPAGNSFISEQFPPGTQEVFVEAGTLLGYQGNYSGDPNNPTGVHLHFSIVKDDGSGKYLNELEIGNTIDPSGYFNLVLNAKNNDGEVPVCPEEMSNE